MAANVETRWTEIQHTRRKNPRTKEPQAGALGLAYLINKMKKNVEKVAVLTRLPDGTVMIQRATGGQTYSVNLNDLRTEAELWAGVKKVAPERLPKSLGSFADGSRWNPSLLPATIVMKAWEATA